MFADVMKLPVESVQVKETGAFGCALISAVACKDYPDISKAVAHMCQIVEPVFPDTKRTAIYDEKYELYSKTIHALDGLWDSIQAYEDRHSF